MKLVTGGMGQGKTDYIRAAYGVEEIWDLQQEENLCMAKQKLLNRDTRVSCVTQLQVLVGYLIKENESVETFLKGMLLAHPDIIISMNQVGNGIVPVDREQRQYRETVGRAGCLLAEQARQVVLVTCGIGTVIKEEQETQ